MIIKRIGLILLATAALSACASQSRQPLYAWGNYEPSLYAYFQNEDNGNGIQLLEEDVAKANSKGLKVAPGVYAHLGLLYLRAGQTGTARDYFNTEKRLHPDSAQFMDFLLKQKGVR